MYENCHQCERKEDIPDVFGAEEMDFWHKNGYIVLKNAVTQAEVEAARQTIWAHLNPRELAPHILKAIPITGNAGDFVIWHQALPHCATPNKGKTPRMVQYFTYLPLILAEEREWK